MSLTPPVFKTDTADGPDIDAFGRFRVSEPFPIWDNKNVHSKHTSVWHEKTSGGTETITHDASQSSVLLTVGTPSGEYAIRQTSRYFAYLPGKSQKITATAVFAPAQANLVQRVGYFDGPELEVTVGQVGNGIFFELHGSTLNLVIRSDASGNIVDEKHPQNTWNKDKLDGDGPSGITLDITKFQIEDFDYQWLGGGRVRYFYAIGGESIFIHEVKHANIDDIVYMRTPTLPIRYEIRNIGVTTGATLKEICSSVSSEGGYILPGVELSGQSDFVSLISLAVLDGRKPILAVRQKNAVNGNVNRMLARFLESSFYTEGANVLFQIAHIHNPSAIDATWVSNGAETGTEYAYRDSLGTGFVSFTPELDHIVSSTAISSGQGGKGGSEIVSSEFTNEHSFINQNFDSTNSDMFVVYATSRGNADVWASMSWIEFE
jgi:hypothetical protein